MNITKITLLILAIAMVLYILLPSLSWAEEGTALSKAKCPAFHFTRMPLGPGEHARDGARGRGVKPLTGNVKEP